MVDRDPHLRICDEYGDDVVLDPADAAQLWAATDGLDSATVSACPGCRSRVVVTLAFVDVLDTAPQLGVRPALVELADAAPSAHLYVVDLVDECQHRGWRDPLSEEWSDMVEGPRRGPVR